MNSPANGATVTVPFDVNFTYNAATTYTKLWIDGVAIISDHTSTTNLSTFDYTVTSLAAGSHTLTLQAHDTASNTTISVHETITVSSAPPTVVNVTPSQEQMLEGTQFTFNSNVSANWSLPTSADGSIPTCSSTTSCAFTAGATTGTATLTATATDGSGATGSANITISSLLVNPASATVVAGETQQFTTSPSAIPVQYSSPTSLGSFSGNTFTAAATTTGTSGTVTATATDSSGATGTASVSVVPLAITPSNPSVADGQDQTFTANAPVTWVATCGSFPTTCASPTSCVFTAPSSVSSGTTCTITAAESAPGTLSVNATATIGSLTLTPGTATTIEGQTQQFTANAAIATTGWSATCGNVAPSTTDPTSATFTAPSSVPPSPGTCTITATGLGNVSAQAVDTITPPPPPTTLNYTTWKNSNDHTGQQPYETTLTPSNVNSKTFGLKFSDAVDGDVYAQPLYLSNITINGTSHNVVFVATEHDSVYAFDADSAGAPLWQVSFLTGGATTAKPSSVHSTIGTEVGITGTPAIDINGSPNPVLYVVAETDNGGTYSHHLHALDVTTGKEIKGSPVTISGSGFSSKQQLQRPALILANGNVYVSFGSEGDNTPWHGWIFAFDTANLSEAPAIWNPSPGGNAGGIWGGGGGLAADSDGNLFAATGNGSWNGTTQYGMSWVKLSPTLQVMDFWTPYNEATLSNGDEDLGSAAPVLVPAQPDSVHPNELIGCGKPTPVYVVDRDNMGGHNSGSDSQIVQSLPSVVGGGTSKQTQYHDHCFTTPAYFNGTVYFVGNNDVIKAFALSPTTGMLSAAPTSQGSFTFLFPGGQPVTSSNGSSDGIVWAVDYNSYDLHAYDANNMSKEIYRSSTVGFTKWMVPTVINGKVYVGSKKLLSVFGLF
ncbi:MAG: hypothetical protein ABSD96_09050 [Candidatus Korobacteraceae bacterium]